MKKLLTITVLMALAMGGFAQILHYDFSAVCETGQTLYYRISNEEEKTVMLTYPFSEENSWFTGDNYYDGHPEPQGEITLPLTVTYNDIQYFITAIDDNAFNYCCGLTGNLTIPEGIVSIGSRAFRHCNFTSITLPKSLEVIVSLDYGYGTPFVYCSSLESISVDDENPIFYSENNAIIRREDKTLVVGCKTTTIPDEIETIGHSAFQGAGDGGDLVIPNSVTAINDYAFYESQFSGTITFSDSLRYIGVKAFSYCHISGSLSIPSSVTEIGNYAFSDCSHLTGNLSLSSSLSTINKRAFQHVGCNGTLIIPNSVNHIGEGAFYFTNFSELVLGNSVTTIEDNAFNNIWNSIHLTGALKLPTSLIEIGREAFAYTAFDEIHSPNTTPPTLNTLAFQQCDNNIPIHIPFGCTEAYQNAEGWNYFTNFIEEEPIIYTDYEPDTCKFITSSHESDFMFDIDLDGTVDMTLSGYTQHGAVLVNIAMSNGFQLCRSNENTILNADTINWFQADDLSNGFPLDSYRKRFGFRKTVGEHYFYGWMEIYWDGIFVPEGKMIYLDRMAFCTIPDYPFRWGQTSLDSITMEGSEWYYEILNDDGSITYQHLECTGDTVMQGKRPKVIVRSNTHYDRDTVTEISHEYIYEENGFVYWWNNELEEFTTLYNLNANVGDEWEIKIGTESLTMHVDAVENYEYEGRTYRMLHVSDPNDLFSGDIVCGIGHLTSFFPERLMNRGKGYRVEGMRCYWVEGELIFKYGDRDCDEVYEQLHNGIEDSPSAVSGTFVVYPNPTNGILTIHHSAFSIPNSEFRITNLMGQTLLQGNITTETQQINIESLPAGMYFITFAGETRKFVVR